MHDTKITLSGLIKVNWEMLKSYDDIAFWKMSCYCLVLNGKRIQHFFLEEHVAPIPKHGIYLSESNHGKQFLVYSHRNVLSTKLIG